ncbi:MAG: hypothetical protein H0T20_04290 [Actinobacteria bacterium]|nr:hypothetical protein [Actinomycetota bacterium]
MTTNLVRRRALVSALAASVLTALTVAGGGVAGPSRALVAPKNESKPTISGNPRVGGALTANPGTWSGTLPITYSYQWVRCNAQMANCTNRARSRTIRLVDGDLGRRLLVVVTARNSDGTGQASVSTGTIGARAAAPRNTSIPTISGTLREGETLTANPGVWEGTQPIAFTYQWQRCDSNGGNCGSVTGATSRTYLVTPADVSRSVRVIVTARSSGGTRAATSAPTGVAQPGGPAGQIRLPNGKISIPIESMALPARLVIDEVVFSPNPVRSRSATITVRVHVADTRSFVVRGALVYMRSLPLLTTTPPEAATGMDGYVTFRMRPRAPRAGLIFPLRKGVNVQFYVQARKAGERLNYGVTATRLTQVRTTG